MPKQTQEQLEERLNKAITVREKTLGFVNQTLKTLKDFNSGKMNEESFKSKMSQISKDAETLHENYSKTLKTQKD